LVGKYVGHTAVKTQEKLDQAIGGVLFIDEAYKLLSNDFGQEAINTIVEAMTAREGEFSVVIAGYPKEISDFLKSNPGLHRRFANQIHLKDYEPETLMDIFKAKMKKDGYSLNQELEDIFPHFTRNWFDARDEKTFGNAGDVLNIFGKMAQNAIYENRQELCIGDVPEELKKYLKKQSDDLMADALAKLDNIVGLESVKENIRRIIVSIKMAKYRDKNTRISAGHYIFKGNPGTGKTTVAKIFGEILKELKVLKKGSFIEATRENLVQGYVGQTAIKTKEVLENSLGGVLFIDEAYSLSNGGENDFGKEAINTIVPFMENNADNFTLIVAGYDKEMDVFLDANTGLKSRFTNTIVFEDYTGSEMLKIFKIFSKGYILGESVDDKLLSIFDKLKQNSTHFGNGRDARKLFDLVRTNLDMRLNNLDDLAQGDKRLNIIELEDLDNC
jgi:SpoVK/Ycf46/Vps4 family AAA+-type ATPase